MALKPSIYKFDINLSDLNRDYYDTLHLTVALHPSETLERMMARVMTYCLNATERLAFAKGLSDTDEPDIWEHSMDDQIVLWIDIGEPAVERIKKATRVAKQVKVYSFNSKSEVWWQQNQSKFALLNVGIYQFNWQEITVFAGLMDRTMHCSVTITGNSAFIASENGECELSWCCLQQ